MSKPMLAIGAGSKRVCVAVVFSAIALFVTGFEPAASDKVATNKVASDKHDAQSPALSRVFDAWKARQARIKTFHVVWDTRFTLPKGAFRFPRGSGLAGMRTDEDFDGGTQPEFTFPRSEWWGDGGDRLRSDFGKFAYDNKHGWKEEARYRITEDGALYSRAEVPVSSSERPTISIWRKVPYRNPSNWSSSGDFLLKNREVDLTPLRLALRPFGPNGDWSAENCRVVSDRAILGDVPCLKIQMDRLDHSEMWWVDPNRDFSVIRWERRQPNAPPLEVAIDVKQGSDHEWYPSRWTFNLLQDEGGRPAFCEATVTHCAINEKLPPETFAAIPPAGARVFDVTADLPIRDSDDRSGYLPDNEARKTLDAIADAWLRRQNSLKTFKITWESESTPWTTLQLTKTIRTTAVDGDKIAYESSTPGWKAHPEPAKKPRRGGFEREGWAVYRSKVAFDGVTKRQLSFCERQGDKGSVNLSTGLSSFDRDQFGDQNLMLVFRPLDKNFGRIQASELRDPSKYHVVAAGGKIGNVACMIIETEPNPGMQQSYWLDPARDYLPLREHRTLNGEDRDRVDLTYRLEKAKGWWIPASWTSVFVGEGGKALSPQSCTVTSSSIDQPIPASEFQIEPPPGARVTDMREGTAFARREAMSTARQAKLAAKLKARESTRKIKPKPKPKAVYDPFADAVADVDAAMNAAKQTHRHVLIEFGANWCPGCRDLGVVLKENAEVTSPLKKGFVLVLVDTDFDTGKKMDEKYVPQRQRNSIPHLAVLDASGKVLTNDDTNGLADGDDFDIFKIKAFLARWSP
jgi:thiol-disulfide isomerase/thioredoxin